MLACSSNLSAAHTPSIRIGAGSDLNLSGSVKDISQTRGVKKGGPSL